MGYRKPRNFEREDNVNSRGRHINRNDFRHKRNDDGPYTVICDECGEECEVPFKPTSSKPVYCDRCFKRRGKPDRVEFERHDRPKQSSGSSDELRQINQKLDKIMRALKIRD